jgi:hypothetical protein
VTADSPSVSTPQELSRELLVPGKTIRRYLRAQHAEGHLDYERWRLDHVLADAVRDYFGSGPDSHPTDALADWSVWAPFFEVAKTAPQLPGDYMMRTRSAREVVYVGMAGGRSGRGLKGRLDVYLRGRGAVSGFGEAALDRALSDVEWLSRRLERLANTEGERTKDWAKAAIERADVEIRWCVTPQQISPRALETAVLRALSSEPLWNRQRPRDTDFGDS